MFTGIITDLGAVRAITAGGDTRIDISTHYSAREIPLGASICCSGVCLTVIDKGDTWFAVTVSGETLSRTTIGGWSVGTPVNLERALRVGDELGGHIVSGHVDGLAVIRSILPEGDSRRFVFETSPHLSRFIAEKGSVALDGISLTVNETDGDCFGINVIPHTWNVTNFGQMQAGDRVNLEIDMLARYVARLLERG